jgi:hypothetical protein
MSPPEEPSWRNATLEIAPLAERMHIPPLGLFCANDKIFPPTSYKMTKITSLYNLTLPNHIDLFKKFKKFIHYIIKNGMQKLDYAYYITSPV